jgi:hypothetical protein
LNPWNKKAYCPFNSELLLLSAAPIVMVKLALPASGGVEESVTLTVNVDALAGPVGTPPIVPLVAPKFSPAGNVPAEIVKLYGAVPPLTCNVCPYAPPIAPLGKVLGLIVNPPPAVLNVTLTVVAAPFNVAVQLGGFVCGLAGVQFVLKLPNVEPEFAVALSVTTCPLVKPAVQVLGQRIPVGVLDTVPVPVPSSITVSVTPPVPVAVP